MENENPNLNGPENDASATPQASGSAFGQESIPTAEELAGLRKKADERDAYRNELLRAKADMDNFQKRMRRERPAWEEQAVRRFLRDLLPVADNLERALSHAGAAAGELGQGVELTRQMLTQVLCDHGVVEIVAAGVPFNPEVHEAVSEVESVDEPTGTVVEVLEKGYRHKDAVLRPSRVLVSRNVNDSGRAATSGDSSAS